VNAIRRSPKSIEELKQFCKDCEIDYHDLPNDCPTRWSSTFAMIKAALLQKPALQLMFVRSEAKYISDALDSNEWKALETHVGGLNLFAEATKALSTYRTPALHEVEEVFSLMEKYLVGQKTSPYKIMASKLREYSPKLSEVHWLSRALHPGIKLGKDDKKYKSKVSELKEHAQLVAEFIATTPQGSSVRVPTPKKKKTAAQVFREMANDALSPLKGIETIIPSPGGAFVRESFRRWRCWLEIFLPFRHQVFHASSSSPSPGIRSPEIVTRCRQRRLRPFCVFDLGRGLSGSSLRKCRM